jgi:hypothetical protein
MSDYRDFCRGVSPTVDCLLCGRPIGPEHHATAVNVHVREPHTGQILSKGPFHAECATRFNALQAKPNAGL